jgi:NADH:ubiquinone oxidoreductase subunit 3 (subunit A)
VVTGALALLAAVGVIGLLEMIHFVAASDATRTTRRLFWVVVAPRTLTPWLTFAALVVAGALGLRWAAPRAAAAFEAANRPAPRP